MKRMGSKDSVRCFRFLDLPPELRNRIYNYVFEDLGPHSIYWIDNKSFLPCPAITATCRQLRSESVQLFKKAQHNFWERNSCFLQFHVNILDYDCRKRLMLTCGAELQSARTRHLIFILKDGKTSDGKLVDLTIEVSIDSDQVQWKVKTNSIENKGWNPSFSWWAQKLEDYFARRQKEMALRLEQDPDFLNVPACVKLFYRPFGEHKPSVGEVFIGAMCERLGYLGFKKHN